VLVATTTLTGLLIVSWMPAVPMLLDEPITTMTSVPEGIEHDAAGEPDAGAAPIRALHV
jgi:hypothetical protein